MEVHAADIQDRDGVGLVLTEERREKYPSIDVVWVDAGYQGKAEERMAKRGWKLEVVRRLGEGVGGVWCEEGHEAPV